MLFKVFPIEETARLMFNLAIEQKKLSSNMLFTCVSNGVCCTIKGNGINNNNKRIRERIHR